MCLTVCTPPPAMLEGLENMNQVLPIIHKVHSGATSNCRRQKHALTWRQNSNAVKQKCVIVMLVTWNFPAIHFSHFPQALKHGVEPLLSAIMCNGPVLFLCTPVYQRYSCNLSCYSFAAKSK